MLILEGVQLSLHTLYAFPNLSILEKFTFLLVIAMHSNVFLLQVLSNR